MRTQVGIIGAGPAGLFLSHFLHRAGIDCVVLEARSRAYVEGRVRAGVLEPGTIEAMQTFGLDGRLKRDGMVDNGLDMRFRGGTIHLDLPGLTGKSVMIYGQQEVVKDLVAARLAANQPLLFEAKVTALDGLEGDRPSLHYHDERQGEDRTLACDFVAGCDGYHGVCRRSIPTQAIQTFERIHPFGWLGILADVPPAAHELIYSNHERGFALCSMRSLQRSRYYVQCGLDEKLEAWTDARFWDELRRRLPASVAEAVVTGPSIDKSMAPLRSFVVEPLKFGRLFLVGDAAHIVPPAGAKGLNLAAADVRVLYGALVEYYRTGRAELIDRYSAQCLRRIWKAVRFSWWFTSITHKFSEDPFSHRLQLAELDYLTGSSAALTSIAENYVGLPFDSTLV